MQKSKSSTDTVKKKKRTSTTGSGKILKESKPSIHPIVQLRNVKRIYTLGENKIYALNGVSFAIKKGDFVTIMGSSGSGKSTLLNMIGCLDLPTSGKVKVNNVDLSKLDDDGLTAIRRNNIGFIFQQFNLIPTLTALENVEIPMIFNGESPSKRRKRALAMLRKADLPLEYADHKPNEMSGGQQQRVAIARALANNPPILLADEPTGNLDTKTGQNIMELLKELNAAGTTVIVVTHDPKLEEYSHTTIRIQDGEVIE
ncbi:ABC transporter ATP-binding protein [Methanolobus sp. WCC1]|jgi:putative ABC transport system ATP-binding protein|uniref:ABC transporter ATP-binding protein n=1 Tax=unclassified Methanolobus TaxID=2629569 RepID=UPI00258D4029|nr:ABC transporter ATP-binding protein [Methanolobus sp.]MDK2830787.1 putative transport system ATP-binding protein [Methanolobus sp.]